MNLLAIDTTEESCSAALYRMGDIHVRYELAPRRHSELILPMIEAVLAEAGLSLAQVDALGFACGPGSFTGLRIAAGVIQGIAIGVQLPVVPVSSLAALAQGAWREHGVERSLAAFDARMHEVYWAAYECDANQLMRPVTKDALSPPAEVKVPFTANWSGVGSGWQAYSSELDAEKKATANYPELRVSAEDVAVLAVADFKAGKVVDGARAIPVYLRDNVAAKPKSSV